MKPTIQTDRYELYLGDSLAISSQIDKGESALFTSDLRALGELFDMHATYQEFKANSLNKVVNYFTNEKFIYLSGNGILASTMVLQVMSKDASERNVQLVAHSHYEWLQLAKEFVYFKQTMKRFNPELYEELRNRKCEWCSEIIVYLQCQLSKSAKSTSKTRPFLEVCSLPQNNLAYDGTSCATLQFASLLTKTVLGWSKRGEWIVEPFMTGAELGIAALRRGRRFVGICDSRDALETIARQLAVEVARGQIFDADDAL